MAQTVKNLPAMQEIQLQSLGQEDALEKGMATHSSILAWRITWTEEPVGVRHDWATFTFVTKYIITFSVKIKWLHTKWDK